MHEKEIEKIKKIVKNSIGKNFDISAKRGRKRTHFCNCTIDSVYPSIFVIRTSDSNYRASRNVSFSYTEILTGNVTFLPPTCDSESKTDAV